LTAHGDDYTTCFNAALRQIGVEVETATWAGRWLFAHIQPGDVVQIHWPSSLYYYPQSRLKTWRELARFTLFLLLLRARGAQIVWTAHNLYPHEGGRASVVHRLARRIVVAFASRVCVHGRSAAKRVVREFGVDESRLVFLEHGNWVGFYPSVISREAARERLGIPRDAYVFLFFGACRPYKNLEHLVLSHQALEDDSRLWIVGRFQSSVYREAVQQAVSGAASERIKLHDGFVPAADVQLYMNACDAVVLPYKEILTSGAVMLATSFGRPVVAPRMGTLEEVVTSDCGVLYDPESPSGLTQAMRDARRRTFDRARIIRRAEEFSWDRSARTFVEQVLSEAEGAQTAELP
jgi:glycosyltransferase involved in cell wall biosynthesis